MEPEDLSGLPVLELAPLSEYRVDPGCRCPNEEYAYLYCSRGVIEDGAARGCATCICAYNTFTFYGDEDLGSNHRNFHHGSMETMIFREGCNDYELGHLEFHVVGKYRFGVDSI